MTHELAALRPQEESLAHPRPGGDDVVARCVESIRRSVAGRGTHRDRVMAVRMLLTGALGAREADRIVRAWLDRLARSRTHDGPGHPDDLVALFQAERRRTRLARRAGEAALQVLTGVLPLPGAGFELSALGELAGALPTAAFSWLAGTGRDEPHEAAEARASRTSFAPETSASPDALPPETGIRDEAARTWARLAVVTFLEALEGHVSERALPGPVPAAAALPVVA